MNRSIFIILLLQIGLFSCIRKADFDSPVKWNDVTPKWKLPLVNTTMSLKDAFNKDSADSFFRIENGVITFIHQDSLIIPLHDILMEHYRFPTLFNFNPAISFRPVPGTILPKESKISLPEFRGEVNLNIDSVEYISELIFKEGKIKIQGISDYKHSVSFKLTIPDLKNANNIPFSEAIVLNYIPSNETIVNKPYVDIANYSLKTMEPDKKRLLYTLSDIVLTIKSDDGITSNPISPEDSLKLNISLSNLSYRLIRGKLNYKPFKYVVSLEESIPIPAFDNAVKADVRFAEPIIDFQFKNNIGILPSIYINKAEMEYAYQKKVAFVADHSSMKIPGNTIIVPGNNGDFVITPVKINNSSSNLTSILTGAPNRFNYSLPEITLSLPENGEAYITNEAQIRILTNIKLPLHGAIKELSIADNREIDLPEAENVDYVDFKISSENSIPLEASFQIYFLDTLVKDTMADKSVKYLMLDSLMSNSSVVVGAAQVNPTNSLITYPTQFETSIPVGKEKYAVIARSNMITIKGTLKTTQAATKDVKFTMNQKLTFKMAIDAHLRIKLN